MASSVSGFLDRMQRLQTGLDALAGQLKRVDAAVGGLYETLLVTRKVDRLVKQLLDLLEATQAALKGLSKVPVVNAVAIPLEKLVGKIKDIVKRLSDQLDKLEQRIAPKREKLKEIGPFARDLIPPVQQLREFVAREQKRAGEADAALEGQADSRYRRSGRGDLHGLVARLDSLLDEPLAQVAEGRKRMEVVERHLRQAAEPCDGLADAARTVSDLMGGLDDIAEDVSAVDETLDQRIGVGTETMTIRQLLEKADIIPKEIVDQAMKALGGPLQELKSSLGLKAPDPATMIPAFVTILKHLTQIEEAIKAAKPELERLVDRGNLPKSFDSIAA